jgi:hypothetical protein
LSRIKGEGRNDTKSTYGKIDCGAEIQGEVQEPLSHLRQAQGFHEEVQYVQALFPGPFQLWKDSWGEEIQLVDENYIADGF